MSVAVYIQTSSVERVLAGHIKSTRITRHSITVREALSRIQGDGDKEVVLTGCAPAAVSHILDTLRRGKDGDVPRIIVHKLPLRQAIAVHQAMGVMRFEPAQPHVEGHILGYVSHDMVTAEELRAIQIVYKGPESRIWKAVIHHISFNIVGGTIQLEQLNSLEEVGRQFPEMDLAMHEKISELKERKERKERNDGRN